MMEIPLTRGLVTLVDDDVHGWLIQWAWHVQAGANTHYAVRSGQRRPDLPREHFQMHRVILDLPPWEPGGVEVDHIDRNGLNNLRRNLRVVTHQEQAMNRINSVQPKPCEFCGELFKPSKPETRFCSSRCFGLRPDNPRTQRILQDLACPECGEMFRPPNHRSKFCSLSCRSVATWRSRRLGLR